MPIAQRHWYAEQVAMDIHHLTADTVGGIKYGTQIRRRPGTFGATFGIYIMWPRNERKNVIAVELQTFPANVNNDLGDNWQHASSFYIYFL